MYCECEYGDGRLPLLFIVNPAAHSGEGYALWKQAEAVLQERSIPYEVYFSEKRGDVRQLAKRLTNVSEGAERFLIVLGGDGTLNEAIQGMQHFEQVRLGYIPTGSSNDLARDLKIGHDIRPLMKKLGWPTIFCNSLVVAEDGEITDYKMRVENSKLTTVRALQSIGFETVASGDSYNDLGMILAGKSGFLFRTTEQIKADYPQIPALETYEELLNALKEA